MMLARGNEGARGYCQPAPSSRVEPWPRVCRLDESSTGPGTGGKVRYARHASPTKAFRSPQNGVWLWRTGGETSLLQAIRPDLVALDKVFETDRSLRPYYAGEPTHLQRRREPPHKYIGVNCAVADSSNDPEGATIERGQALLETIVERVAIRARALLADSTSAASR